MALPPPPPLLLPLLTLPCILPLLCLGRVHHLLRVHLPLGGLQGRLQEARSGQVLRVAVRPRLGVPARPSLERSPRLGVLVGGARVLLPVSQDPRGGQADPVHGGRVDTVPRRLPSNGPVLQGERDAEGGGRLILFFFLSCHRSDKDDGQQQGCIVIIMLPHLSGRYGTGGWILRPSPLRASLPLVVRRRLAAELPPSFLPLSGVQGRVRACRTAMEPSAA